MTRLLFVLWSTGRAGGTRVIFEVSNRLADRGYSVGVIALGGEHKWFSVRVPVNYVTLPEASKRLLALYRVFRLRRGHYSAFAVEGIARKLGFHADLVRLLAEHIPDADVHVATFYPTALAVHLSRGGGRKFYLLQDFPELVMDIDGEYGLKLFELTLRLPFDSFLCDSSYLELIARRYQPGARTIVTGVGVDTTVFNPKGKKIIDSRGRKIVMFIVRGSKYKGDEVAVEALNIASRKTALHAIIVGRKKSVNDLFKRSKPEFTYDVFENVSDQELAQLYSSADVFLFTSYVEGFGLPPLEAMACGTPVVTTDCMGNRDYAYNEYNSLVVPPGDPQAVSEALVRILTSDKLREKLIENGLETARRFTWDKVVDRFEEALKG
ncbi:glycosyltransferase family 4 protein [Desulfurococcus mucosus]|uniref:glycosyltransferase family 4 protein n=1 Tax=Desulfurococcus mucosus TaxID=2275 RepID=UPI000A03E18B|nr:glycosyltransferase family 4 protein [Desulfurococcus mucosus]